MTSNNPPLIFLDLENKYEKFENIFNSQLLYRFTNKIQCLEYVLSRSKTIRSLHFFIPKCEHNIINLNLNFSNIIYYIYCTNDENIYEIIQQYNFPMFIKIFHIESLLMNLFSAATIHWIDQGNRTQHEPDEYDIALQTGAELSNALAKELHQHMIFKTGLRLDDDDLTVHSFNIESDNVMYFK